MIQNTRVGGAVRFLSHDLHDQTLERDDAGCGLATSKNMGSTDIPSRQIGYRTAAFVFVLDPHRPARRWRQTRVFPPPRLDAGLFVRRQHAIGVAERPALPDTLIQTPGCGKLRVSREDSAMAPGPDRIFRQPPPDRGRPTIEATRLGRIASAFRSAYFPEAGQRQIVGVRQLDRPRFNLDDGLGGESEAVVLRCGVRRSVYATYTRSADVSNRAR